MKFVYVLIIALLTPVAALAKGECDADMEKFCKGLEQGDEFKTCIEQHKGEMSEACQAWLDAKAKQKTGKVKGPSNDDTKQ